MLVSWTDRELREACRAGTLRELEAYSKAGYSLLPQLRCSMTELLERVAAKYKVTPTLIRSTVRTADLIKARVEFCAEAYAELGKTTPVIAKFLGGRDHSGVLHLLTIAGVRKCRPTGRRSSFCKRGHPLTPENVWQSAWGKRQCKACAQARQRKRAESKRSA